MGCYTVQTASQLPSFRDKLSVPTSKIDKSSRNFDNYQSAFPKIPEERRYNWHRGGSLKLREKPYVYFWKEWTKFNSAFCIVKKKRPCKVTLYCVWRMRSRNYLCQLHLSIQLPHLPTDIFNSVSTHLRAKRLAWHTAVCRSCWQHWHIKKQVTTELSQQRTPWLITSSIFPIQHGVEKQAAVDRLHCRLESQHFRPAAGAFQTNDTSSLIV
jgi:hypothetical protein